MGAAQKKQTPTRAGAAWFALRLAGARLRRLGKDLRTGPKPLKREQIWPDAGTVAEVRSPLWSSLSPKESHLELGKVQNLRVAARRFNGLVLEPGVVFSFWRQLGPTSRRKGFVDGRQLQEGCLIASRGGGICQLSNALYEAADKAGLEIVERHRHTQVVRGSAAERGQDATVAWNHVDLRFRSDRRLQLRVSLTRDELLVSFTGLGEDRPERSRSPEPSEGPSELGSCDTCGETACFRHIPAGKAFVRTAFLLDEKWPEFETWVRDHHKPGESLLAPVNGARWRKPLYNWHGVTGTATLDTLRFSRRLRSVSEQGAARQGLMLERSRAIAERYAAQLRFDEANLVIQLSLLPYLWMGGHLGGRRFTVLTTRLPIDSLQSKLDEALSRFPDRRLLGDFRAPEPLVRAEREALDAADRIVTPHTQVAEQFGCRAELIPWHRPAQATWLKGPAIGFPGPAVGRKGAFEVREAAKALGLNVVCGGKTLEADGFWGNVAVRRGDVLEGSFAIVQPALLEDRPRALLKALSAGCPVVCSPDCGLEPGELVRIVPFGDTDALIEAISTLSPRAL